MTREEKISRLKDILSEINENDNAVCYLTSEDNELIESAIEALEQEPQTFEWCHNCSEYNHKKHCCPRYTKVIRNAVEEMKPCEDAISRQELLEDLYKRDYTKFTHRDFVALVQYQDTVQQEPKTGHWIDTNSDRFVSHKVYKCSECGTTEIEYPENIYRHFRYCPNCGAKMESEG